MNGYWLFPRDFSFLPFVVSLSNHEQRLAENFPHTS